LDLPVCLSELGIAIHHLRDDPKRSFLGTLMPGLVRRHLGRDGVEPYCRNAPPTPTSTICSHSTSPKLRPP